MNAPDPNLVVTAVLLFYCVLFISFLVHEAYTLRILQTPTCEHCENEDPENNQPKKPSRIRYIPQVQSQKRKKR